VLRAAGHLGPDAGGRQLALGVGRVLDVVLPVEPPLVEQRAMRW
jgi:hypothetical protein